MSEKDVYIGKTSIQIGENGFINQPKEIIEYIKYLQNQLQQEENIIKEVREEVRIYEEQSNDGATNELDNYVFVQRLKNVLDKGE